MEKQLSVMEALTKAIIIMESAGCKTFAIEEPPSYTLPKADIYLDCRGVANPCYQMSGSGDDPLVQGWVEENTNIAPYVALIMEALTRIPTRRKGQDQPFAKPVRVLCFCAHGIHRSRAMKHILASRLKQAGAASVEVK